MIFFDRGDTEKIGRTGTRSYSEIDPATKLNYTASRILSSYWVCSDEADEAITPHFKKDGFWESWITLWISRNVKPGSVCIDAGANYGYFTFQLAQHGCKVYAIEANPHIIPYLEKSVELNGCADRVSIISSAAADFTGKVISLNLQKSSINATITGKSIQEYGGTVEVYTLALDEFADYKFYADSRPIDFVKMDIEGAEELAWRGMQRFLDFYPKCTILMEFVPQHYDNNGTDFLADIQKRCDTGYIDYFGVEREIENSRFFEIDKEPFRMITIRRKKDNKLV